MQRWTQEEIDYVVEHYPYERAEDVGNAIGRSNAAVMHIARAHGVKKDKEALSRIKSISNSGANSGNFKGYVQRTQEGYIKRRVPGHPCADSKGYVLEHRLVVEKHLGYFLPKGFVVHHLNGVKDDNRIDNLAVLTVGAHSAMHGRMGRNIPKGEQHYKYKAVDVDELKRLRAEGYTVDKICKETGICKQTYYRRLKEENHESTDNNRQSCTGS